MSNPTPNITINVDITNPGQFFACCGLLELADRLWPGAEGCFVNSEFCIHARCGSLGEILDALGEATVSNTMTSSNIKRLEELSGLSKQQLIALGAEDEKKSLESLRRELPILLTGRFTYLVDWFTDDFTGGLRFKTWAGQQSVLAISQAMHGASRSVDHPWGNQRGLGVPFNFDSDLGGQGSGIDIGFVFDALAGSEGTRIRTSCKPTLELLCFIGLQRFRPRELPLQRRFIFSTWSEPLPPSVAAAVVGGVAWIPHTTRYEFKLLYRTKYLKSFLPATIYQGDDHE